MSQREFLKETINLKQLQLAQEVEVATEEWVQGNNQKLLHLSQEMDDLFLAFYNSTKESTNVPYQHPQQLPFEKSNISLWIQTITVDNKKIYECWVDEFETRTCLGNFFKRTSKWPGGGAQNTGIQYIQEKYPHLSSIQIINFDPTTNKVSATWKSIKISSRHKKIILHEEQ
jgi:hypothetical protein